MEVRVAKTAGFCFGVKRAVQTVYEQIDENNGKEPLYTYGPIIHNEQVVEDLERKGVKVIDEGDLDTVTKGIVIIRSHGVEKRICDRIEQSGLRIVDATCPFVKKIHKTVMEKSREGYGIIIAGNAKHPEVQGIRGWSGSETFVIGTEEEAEKIELSDEKKYCIVAQTTFNYKKFDKMVEILAKKRYDIVVANTICNATNERQTEARQIAAGSDAMIVIGGSHSSNTQKLYEICKEECKDTYYIQKLEDLDVTKLDACRIVGITAGASTPNNIIEEVQTHVRI